jgi:hypothetical protein
MPAFLADPSPALLLLLGIAALITLGVWFRWRNKKVLIAAVALLLLLGLTLLLGSMYESPREQAVRRIYLMCEAATKSDGDKFIEQVSHSFKVGEVKRDALKVHPAWVLIRDYKVTVTASGFSRDDFQQISDSECVIGFITKADAQGTPMLRYTKGTFIKDPDGVWRLKNVAFFNAFKNNEPEPIPGFP